MPSQNENERPRSRRKQRERSPLPWFLAFLVLIVGALAYFLYFDQISIPESGRIKQPDAGNSTGNQALTDSPLPQNTSGADLPSADGNDKSEHSQVDGGPSSDTSSMIQDSTKDISTSDMADRNMTPLDETSQDIVETDVELKCSTSILTIKDFYSHLDQQEYLVPYQLDKPSEQYFSNLLQKVVDNPPIVTGETDDLFNILQNTAHFFRVVGKKNIFTLKAILDREKDSFENVLAEFYKLTDSPVCLEEGFGLMIPEAALYDYAGFFLNTMGGRLYLFRRDSVSRLAVSYYSILIVDRANNKGTNKHGIDIGPAIRSLIDELENSGSRLRLRDEYLDKLYGLEEKYMSF